MAGVYFFKRMCFIVAGDLATVCIIRVIVLTRCPQGEG